MSAVFRPHGTVFPNNILPVHALKRPMADYKRRLSFQSGFRQFAVKKAQLVRIDIGIIPAVIALVPHNNKSIAFDFHTVINMLHV